MAICGNCFNNIPDSGACPICGYDNTENARKYASALPVGTVLNRRFFAGRVLGEGGFGITYLAQDYVTKERVAIKEYFPTEFIARDKNTGFVQLHSEDRGESFLTGKQQFLAEARTLAEFIGDEHIVRIYRYFEENDTAYFAMEYVQGKALNKYIEDRKQLLTADEANEIFLPLMESLANVHTKGIVHRDISPDNIIIQPDGSGKIIDFGAARYSTGEMSKSLDVVLKHGFAPPEQYVRRGRQGPFTDIYALAATYYFAITGKVPPDSVERIVDDTLVPPSRQNSAISKKLDPVLTKALAPNYKDRYQSMGEFRAALTKACGIDSENVKSKAESGKKHGFPIWLKIAIPLLAVILALTVMFVSRICNIPFMASESQSSEDSLAGLPYLTEPQPNISFALVNEYGAFLSVDDDQDTLMLSTQPCFWRLSPSGNGYHILLDEKRSLMFDLDNAYYAVGTRVHLFTDTGYACQNWQLREHENGFIIQSAKRTRWYVLSHEKGFTLGSLNSVTTNDIWYIVEKGDWAQGFVSNTQEPLYREEEG